MAKIKGDPEHPSSRGDLCLKAVYLPEILRTADRLLYPQIRSCQDGPFKRASWDQAMTYLAKRFRDIIDEHGPDAVAFYGSGQLTTEEYYIANKLVKGFIGTNNFDTNSRLCMASAVAGYKTSFGADGPPNSYADIDEANCIFLIGTNTADCHPVIFKRIKQRKQSAPDEVTIICRRSAAHRDRRLRRSPLADSSGYAISRCSTACFMFCSMKICSTASLSTGHTNGFAELRENVKDYSPKVVEAICGVPECLIVEAALIFGKSARARCRSGAWASIRALSVCTRTTRSIICIWPPARSASPAAGRFR